MDLEKVNILRNRIIDELKNYDIVDVILFDAMRYSGITRKGLAIKRTRYPVMPVFLLDDDDDIEDRADEIIDYFKKMVNVNPRFILALEKRDKYERLLEKYPHKEFYDMLIIVKYTLDDMDGDLSWRYDESRFSDVTKDILEGFGISEDELFKKAYEDTKDIFELEFGELEGYYNKELAYCQNDKAFFVSNNLGLYGSSSILFDDHLYKMYQHIGENYYIVVCNQHVSILVPESSEYNPSYLLNSMNFINDNYGIDSITKEVLFYNGETKKVKLF